LVGTWICVSKRILVPKLENLDLLSVIFLDAEHEQIFHRLGATLEIITDKSQEGAQFCKGFGGIGGMYCCMHCCLVTADIVHTVPIMFNCSAILKMKSAAGSYFVIAFSMASRL